MNTPMLPSTHPEVTRPRVVLGQPPKPRKSRAIAPGTIIVANPDAVGGAGALIAVDPNTGAQTLLSQGQHFVEPTGVAFAKDGRILVSDTKAFQGDSGGLIAVNPANGLQTRVMGSTLFRRPFGMAVQADGQVLVACLEQAVIRVNPANGDFVNAIPSVNFDMPAGVALDAAGNIIVADVDTSGEDSRLFRIDTGVGASIRALVSRRARSMAPSRSSLPATSSSPASRTTHRRSCYVSLRRAER